MNGATASVTTYVRHCDVGTLATMPRKSAPKQPQGPRGGVTTVTKSGMVRKTLWLHEDEAEALRERAYGIGDRSQTSCGRRCGSILEWRTRVEFTHVGS